MAKAKKKIMLPLWMKDQADLFAKLSCDLVGAKKGTPSYERHFKKAHTDFCMDAYRHSLTPPEKESNPYSPKISSSSFELAPLFFSDKSKLLSHISDPNIRADVKRRLRSSITNLTQVHVEHLLGLSPKSDFVFKKGSGTNELKLVEINRYARLFVMLQILKALSPLFSETTPTDVLYALKEQGISENSSLESLKSETTRKNFIKAILG